jgi:cation:H+ antiporter
LFSNWICGADLPTWALLVEIVLAGLVVVASGARLTLLADKVGLEYRLGGAWIGLLLLATVTSLPEVATGCTAVWIGRPDLAFAAIFGSCSFNIVLIFLFNFFVGGGSILTDKSPSHKLSSSFGIVLISLTLIGMLLVAKFEGRPAWAESAELVIAGLIAITYITCMHMISRGEPGPAQVIDEAIPQVRTPGLLLKVAGVSAVLVVAAWWLAQTGDVLADHPIKMIGRSLGATFVGSLFLAVATSLPEIVTGLSAVRLGNLDMALGNIFGSNMFNIFVVPMLKVSSLLSGQTLLMTGEQFRLEEAMIAGVLPILLTGVVMGGLSYRTQRRVLKRFGIDSALIAAIYVLGMILIVLR